MNTTELMDSLSEEQRNAFNAYTADQTAALAGVSQDLATANATLDRERRLGAAAKEELEALKSSHILEITALKQEAAAYEQRVNAGKEAVKSALTQGAKLIEGFSEQAIAMLGGVAGVISDAEKPEVDRKKAELDAQLATLAAEREALG